MACESSIEQHGIPVPWLDVCAKLSRLSEKHHSQLYLTLAIEKASGLGYHDETLTETRVVEREGGYGYPIHDLSLTQFPALPVFMDKRCFPQLPRSSIL